jgi:DNA repair ATPase RecN
MSQHRNPLAEADIAMLYGLLGEESLSELYIDKSVQAMSAAISNYTKLKSRQQSQERVEMQNLIGQWLRLINQAEDFNLENIRISLADEYFNVIDGYLKTSFEQLERMWQRADFYSEEINRTLEQLNIIYGMAEAYEEQLREPPAFLLQNSLEVE